MIYRFFLSLLFALSASGLLAQNLTKHQIPNVFSKADAEYKAANYDKALKLYLNVGSRFETKKNAEELRLYIKSQYNVAKCYNKLQEYKEAMETIYPLLSLNLDAKAKEVYNDFYVDNALSYATPMFKNNLDSILTARNILNNILPYAKDEMLDKVKSNIQLSYIKESECLSHGLNFGQNVELLQKAFDMYDNEDNRLQILYYIASLHESKGHLIKSLEYYEKARQLAVKLSNDNTLYKILNSERVISKELNDVQKYTSLGASLDSLIEKNNDVLIKVEYYDTVGNEYLELHKYNVAEMYFNRIRDIFNDTSGSIRFVIAIHYYSSMRDLRHAQGDFKSAIDYSRKLVDYSTNVLEQENNFRYIMYLVESKLYAEMQDSVNFEHICDTLINAESFNSDAFNKALVYNFRANGYSKLNNHLKALENCIKSDSILAQCYDETFNMRMDMLEMRILKLKSLNRIDEARKLLERYMSLVVKVYGEKSKKYSDTLVMLAEIESDAGNLVVSAEKYIKSIDILTNILRKQMRYVPSTNRTLYLNGFFSRLWRMSSLALKYSSVNKEFVEVCYNTILKLKSLLFQSDMSMYNTLKLKGSKEDVEDFVRLSFLRNKHKKLIKDSEKNKEKIDANRAEILKLDNKLTNRCKLYKDYTSFLDFKYDDVRAMLGKNDVLFDFFDYVEKGVGHVYVAYVVKKNKEYPTILKLFTSEEAGRAFKDYALDGLYNDINAEKVYDLFWKKLEPYAKRGCNVYYVPSGQLSLVSLESLPLKKGKLLGERYNFVRLTSTRELNTKETEANDFANAVLYGGLNYDMDVEEMRIQNKKYKNIPVDLVRGGLLDNCKFDYLPGTLDEINDIKSILTQKGLHTTCYSGNEGTEGSFVSMHNDSPELLHIATHAFYFTPEEAMNVSFLKGNTDAMLLSGLVMSGGNTKWTSKENAQDVMGGILTSENISCLDLSNINLVVLSACKTAKGKITNEGVYGLQRAFKKAGAKTIVMTLWEVSDVVTREFMVEFYNNLFSDNKYDKREAFNKAKLHIRKKYPEPLYWAGFLMID